MKFIINYHFNGKYPQKVKQAFIEANDKDIEIISKYLFPKHSDTKNDDKAIDYFVFDSREGKQEADPNHSISRASARADKNSIYRYFDVYEDPHFPHELVHIVAHHLGKPYVWEEYLDTYDQRSVKTSMEMVSTSFMQEGLAVALDDMLFHRKIYENGRREYLDDLVKETNDQYNLINKSILNFDEFCAIPNNLSIPFTGSFSKTLINQYGIEKYIEVYKQQKETNSVKENNLVFKTVLGKEFRSLVQERKGSLSS